MPSPCKNKDKCTRKSVMSLVNFSYHLIPFHFIFLYKVPPGNNDNETFDHRRNSSSINNPSTVSAVYQSPNAQPPLQKYFQYDFLSNKVLVRQQPPKNPRGIFYGSGLKNLYEDNNPVIYSHNVQNNVVNDQINSKKKIYAGMENDYSEIPRRYFFQFFLFF